MRSRTGRHRVHRSTAALLLDGDEPAGAVHAAYYPHSMAFPGAGTSGSPRHATPVLAGQPGEATAGQGEALPAAGQTQPGPGDVAATARAPHSGRFRMWFPLVAAVITIAAAAIIGAVAGYRAAARSSVAAFQSDAAQVSAAAADVPDLKELADRYFAPGADISGSADALDITITSPRLLTDLPALAGFLSELGFSDAVLDRTNHTRALDGTQSAQGHNCNITWTYHPDDGLQLVFEAAPGH